MKSDSIITWPLSRLTALFVRENPGIASLAASSADDEAFIRGLSEWVSGREQEKTADTPQTRAALKRIRTMLAFEGRSAVDLSTDREICGETFSLLRETLRCCTAGRGQPTDAETTSGDHPPVNADYMLDVLELFRQARGVAYPVPSLALIRRDAARWPSGLDREVQDVRAENKRRIIELLIEKVEGRSVEKRNFVFPAGISRDEKRRLVEGWWSDFRFHLAMAIRSPRELNRYLDHSLPADTLDTLAQARKKNIPFFITPYYASLLDPTGKGYDDRAIRSYVVYSRELVETYGSIRAWEKEDVVVAGEPNAAGWIVPGHNIHRRYPDVAILIPDSMGRACGGLCAVCQRMYDFQNERLNFEFKKLAPTEHWAHKLRRLMHYFEEDSQLRDILITGGDALMSQNATLRNILDAVYRMAFRKRRANRLRPEGAAYAELQRVRLGTRLPAYLPMRIDDELVSILREFREKASAVGVTQFIIQTHFESPLEMTPEAREGIRKLQSAGWVVTNQLVFTAASSRRGHTLRLRETLNREGVIGYYTFSVKGFGENYALYAPNARSMQEQVEEKKYGAMTEEAIGELMSILGTPEKQQTRLRAFMRRHRLSFLATDRNVLNLPGIGKSMTFESVGLTCDGRRILRFGHDPGRSHSPVIDRIGAVYITENKSLGAYLRDLSAMGENTDHYRSVWMYDSGETEPRFPLFEYPEQPAPVTDRITNLQIE